MSNINTVLSSEQLEDAIYLEELNNYVKTLATPNAESVALYNIKLSNLEDIHTEIRLTHPNFMPIYDRSIEVVCKLSLGKYQDMCYSISKRDIRAE